LAFFILYTNDVTPVVSKHHVHVCISFGTASGVSVWLTIWMRGLLYTQIV